jgi:hypothetical protein
VVDPPCPVCGYDASQLTPPDAVVAVRSYPRRFRELFEEAEERSPGATTRVGRSGRSARDHAARVAAVLAGIDHDLGRVTVSDNPAIDPPGLDGPPAAAGADSLADLASAADALAARMAGVTGDEWRRTGTDPAGDTWTALDLVRRAVHAGAHHLRLAERVLAEPPE